jgi:hypothetical protein
MKCRQERAAMKNALSWVVETLPGLMLTALSSWLGNTETASSTNENWIDRRSIAVTTPPTTNLSIATQ